MVGNTRPKAPEVALPPYLGDVAHYNSGLSPGGLDFLGDCIKLVLPSRRKNYLPSRSCCWYYVRSGTIR